MKKEEILKIFDKCIEERGIETQSRQAMEELAELIQAINKRLRYPEDGERRLNLVEEIGDVLIMIYQLKVMFDIDDEEIENKINYKAEREKKRLGLEETNYKENFDEACRMLADICNDKAGCFDSVKCPFKEKDGFCEAECEKEEKWKEYLLKKVGD